MGVLSALPLVAAGNCCCLWVIGGGVVAAYLLQQNQAGPLTPADGALVGLLAGLIGAVVHFVVSIPVDLLVAPMERAILQKMIDTFTLPPEAREVIERYGRRDGEMSAAFFIMSRLIGLMFWLFLGAIFSTLGGLLGALIFRKTPPPPGAIEIIPPQA
jgi:hypothetical protein